MKNCKIFFACETLFGYQFSPLWETHKNQSYVMLVNLAKLWNARDVWNWYILLIIVQLYKVINTNYVCQHKVTQTCIHTVGYVFIYWHCSMYQEDIVWMSVCSSDLSAHIPTTHVYVNLSVCGEACCVMSPLFTNALMQEIQLFR